MKHISPLCFFLALLFSNSCQTFVSADGSKHRQFSPAKDKTSLSEIDTNKYILLPFSVADYSDRATHKNGKRIVELISASDVRLLAVSKKRYLIYFWNPTCGGTVKDIHILDSLSRNGANVIVASLRNTVAVMDSRLQKTIFSQYPLFVIHSEKYPKGLLVRKIAFIKESCKSCYEQFRDDLEVTDYLLLDNQTITPVFYNNPTNVLYSR